MNWSHQMPNQMRILIVDDHTIVHEGLLAVLSAQPDFEVVGSAYDGLQAVALEASLKPDVTLMDLVMPRMDGLDAIRRIRQANQHARILLMTSFADDERVFQAIKSGAMGYLLKDMPREQLYRAVREVDQGNPVLQPTIAHKILQELQRPSDLPLTEGPLTAPEGETLRLVAQGFNYEDIAARMGVDRPAVARYASAILDKLHLADHTHAALFVLGDGPPG